MRDPDLRYDQPADGFASFAATLIGLPINHVWRGYGSAIFMEFGQLRPGRPRTDGSAGNAEGEVTLGVEWSWRIEDRRAIRCGSWSDEDLWEPALRGFLGARILRCDLFGFLPEIAITTDGGLRFLSFSTTNGQPEWWLTDRRTRPHRSFRTANGLVEVEAYADPPSRPDSPRTNETRPDRS